MEIWTGFLLGGVGSLHCAGMCGPLAMALPTAGASRSGYVLGRLAYNAGRLLTYGLLGVLFGLAGQAAFMAGLQRWVSLALGVAILAGWLVSRRVALNTPVVRFVAVLKAGMGQLLGRRGWLSLGLLGALNGLLPCGLVYVACAGAASTGAAGAGAAYMLAFGLGTVPVMLALSLAGRSLQRALRLRLPRIIPVCLVGLSLLLILRGLSLGIPFLSPDLGATASASCHIVR
jgi:sulfite exporter TauE/SafE